MRWWTTTIKPGDPVFLIPANAPHSDSELRSRTYSNVLTGEELNPVVGSNPVGRRLGHRPGNQDADVDVQCQGRRFS